MHFPALPAAIPVLGVQHLLLEGSHGVDLFFVLSGFCLSYPVLRKLRAAGSADFNVYRYFAKRIVRIVPPYYLALAVFSATALSMAPFGLTDLLKQALFLDRHTAFVNGSFWTLCVEFRWYFWFPLALVLWIRAPRAFLALSVAAVVTSNFSNVHGATDAVTALPFMLGIIAAQIEIDRPAIVSWAAAGIAPALLGGLLYEMYGGTEAVFYFQSNPGWQIAAFCFVVASAQPVLRRLLSWRPLTLVGTASYSIYLVHEPIIVFIEARVPAGPLLGPLAIAASIGAGFLFWLLWERLWTSGRVKERAIRSAESACAFVGARLQIPRTIPLGRSRDTESGRAVESAAQRAPALAVRAS